MLVIILLATVLNQTLTFPAGSALAKLGSNMVSMFIVFGLLYWVGMARLIRGQILSIKENEFVLAARSIGAKPGWIIRKHILPNCLSVIIVSTALQIPSAIFTESYLSFIGLGVNAPMPSLGSLANSARQGLQTYPYKLSRTPNRRKRQRSRRRQNRPRLLSSSTPTILSGGCLPWLRQCCCLEAAACCSSGKPAK